MKMSRIYFATSWIFLGLSLLVSSGGTLEFLAVLSGVMGCLVSPVERTEQKLDALQKRLDQDRARWQV
jgi:hypothetical protein